MRRPPCLTLLPHLPCHLRSTASLTQLPSQGINQAAIPRRILPLAIAPASSQRRHLGIPLTYTSTRELVQKSCTWVIFFKSPELDREQPCCKTIDPPFARQRCTHICEAMRQCAFAALTPQVTLQRYKSFLRESSEGASTASAQAALHLNFKTPCFLARQWMPLHHEIHALPWLQ